jgi:hypothetical protein
MYMLLLLLLLIYGPIIGLHVIFVLERHRIRNKQFSLVMHAKTESAELAHC